MEKRFLCKHCRHVFDLAVAGDVSMNGNLKCPACSGQEVSEAPPWVPLGSGFNIFDNDEWKYECQQCKQVFSLPIPRTVSEDESRRCPACASPHLHLLVDKQGLPLYCG